MVQVTTYLTSGEVTAQKMMTSPRHTGVGQCGGNLELQAIIFSFELDLGNNSVINAMASSCPLCPKAFVIKDASKLFMVDEELDSPGVEALCG